MSSKFSPLPDHISYYTITVPHKATLPNYSCTCLSFYIPVRSENKSLNPSNLLPFRSVLLSRFINYCFVYHFKESLRPSSQCVRTGSNCCGSLPLFKILWNAPLVIRFLRTTFSLVSPRGLEHYTSCVITKWRNALFSFLLSLWAF